MTDIPSTDVVADDATIAGSHGFVLSIDWEGSAYILGVLDTLAGLMVAVTPSGDAPAFDAMVRRTDDGIVFEPWNLEADESVGDPVPFDTEAIDGVHCY